jgi:phage terminase small subunit
MDEIQPPIKRGRGRPKGSKNKPKTEAVVTAADLSMSGIAKHEDPLEFLLGVMNNDLVDPRLRVRAAVSACQYKHTRRADGGKREEEAQKAEKAAKGRFATPRAPVLAVNNT